MFEQVPLPVAGEPDVATDVRQVFERIDAETAAFREATGLACPPLCGSCCLSPHVTARVEELVPLAEELVRRGEAALWLGRLAERAGDPRCALYAPSADDPERGRCSVYAWRPTVCRLYGFAARRDKHGRPELAGCAVHRRESPAEHAAAVARVAAGEPVPMMSDHARRIGYLHPGGGARELAINEALARALEAAALRARFAAEGALEAGESPDPRVDPPAHRPAA